MDKWEYCVVTVAIYREGSSLEVRELLTLALPGKHPVSVVNTHGLAGLLNQLGSEGWELVDVESGTFYLKRRARPQKALKRQ
jgi:hypothetical protein